MERSIYIATTISLLVCCLSHILRPRAWVEFFIYLRTKGTTGVFMTAFIHIPLGVAIVSRHNVWSGIPMIVTILGWGWLIKGTLYFVFPRVGLWALGRVSMKRANNFVLAGAVFGVLSVILAYGFFWAGP